MKNGEYILVVAPEKYPGKKYRGRYVYEHHLVWWLETGNLVPQGYVIHHKNENKTDNRIENLELKTLAEHTKDHVNERPVDYTTIVCRCGNSRTMRLKEYEFKAKITKEFFCSIVCARKYSCGGKLAEIPHGKRHGYTYHKCRCDLCRAAQAEYMRKSRVSR